MADLEPLIRYRKHQLDEKQKFLAALYLQADMFIQQRAEILQRIEEEKSALSDPAVEMIMAASQGFGVFLNSSKQKMEEIKHKEKQLDTRIQIAMNDMRETFGELKKVEITQANRLEKERKELQKREDQLFEEIALQIFEKNKEI